MMLLCVTTAILWAPCCKTFLMESMMSKNEDLVATMVASEILLKALAVPPRVTKTLALG